jgi:hypothetical protein
VVTEQETKAGATSEVCAACGTDARPDSQFCYNCGGSLAIPVESKTDNSGVDRSGSTNGIAKADDLIKAGPGLRSAASIRKEPKAFQRKPIQIVWEPAEGESNFLLILTAILILVFALGAVGLALYFK